MKTRKHFMISVTLFTCAIVSSAQQTAPINSATNPAPAIAKEYVSQDGRFKVLFPNPPNEFHEPVDTAIGKLPMHMLICPTSTVSYHVFYMDYPFDLEKAGLVKKALDSAREGSLSRVAKEEPHVIKDDEHTSLDGYPARFLQIELKGDAMVRIKSAVIGNRVYVVGLGAPKRKPNVVDATNDYEAIATRFMDSFKIIPPLEADTSTTWKDFSSTEGGFKVQFPGMPQNSSGQVGSLGVMHSMSYLSAAAYSAMYLDYPETPKDLIAMIELMDSIRLGELDTVAKQGMPSLVSETTTSQDGYPGRFLVLELANNWIYRRKMLLVKNRLYFIAVTAPKDDSKTGTSYEALSLRFINSFSFMAQPAKD